MPAVSFRTKLIRPVGVGTWTFAAIPKEVSAEAGFRPRMRVRGTINGAPIRSSLMPRGGGVLFVVVPQAIREQIQRTDGDPVELRIEIDRAPPKIVVPPALAAALRKDAKAQSAFDGLAPSHRKAYAQWVGSAVQDETRARRVAKALTMLRAGKTLN